jgi:predicted O-methyltransferase YrrM
MSVLNILTNMLRPGYFRVMAGKLGRRLSEGRRDDVAAESDAWCAERVEDVDAFARSLDANLWQEACEFGDTLKTRAAEKLAALDFDLGGGGDYRLLYFLARLRSPRVVVETGVAAGYSSTAILTALDAVGDGKLYSSDFPYFRLANPERYIGFLVDEPLRKRWHLHIEGDEKNLPAICAECGPIDLFHYDSDKYYAGRNRALAMVEPYLADKAIVIIDDIQNDLFFRDYVERRGLPYRVFGFWDKYLGVIGV